MAIKLIRKIAREIRGSNLKVVLMATRLIRKIAREIRGSILKVALFNSTSSRSSTNISSFIVNKASVIMMPPYNSMNFVTIIWTSYLNSF
jgi:ABC-type uncharacterized transport system substrate-binding protein